MVEFNLLPDVKLQYLQAKKMKGVVISLSILIGAVSLAVFVVLIIWVDVIQKVRLNNLNSSTVTAVNQIQSNTNLSKILTIQNQLQALPTIEGQTPTTSRLFNYISDVTPAKATISDVSFNFTLGTVTVSGGADSLNTVNQFVDTLKFTNYNDSTSKNNPAFSTVVLSSFNYSSAASSSASPAQYTITFNFDPKIFSSTENITLVVPPETTTRSIISQPADLFKSSPTPTGSNQSGN